MEVNTTPEPETEKNTGFTLFAAVRVVAGVAIAAGVIWLLNYGIDFMEKSELPYFSRKSAGTVSGETWDDPQEPGFPAAADTGSFFLGETANRSIPAAGPSEHAQATPREAPAASREAPADSGTATPHAQIDRETQPVDHGEPAPAGGAAPAEAQAVAAGQHDTGREQPPAVRDTPAEDRHGAPPPPAHGQAPTGPRIKGIAFMEAFIKPMNFEVNERFWGWRPNDLIEFTDNVNNYQLGVLETTRRTIEVLDEHISRTGSTQSRIKHLERARSNFMIAADKYWLPSAENSYQDALDAARQYKEQLENETTYFYTRTANLLPLLRAYEYLLGSCDDNLVKRNEEDGKPVSSFRSDDYFYYAQGVAASMVTILEAVAIDFTQTIEPRRGTEVLHHAIESLHHATEVDPIIILNSSPDSLLANHRLNLAGPISHARFFIGLLIETLST